MTPMTPEEWGADIARDLLLVLGERLHAIQDPPDTLSSIAIGTVGTLAGMVLASCIHQHAAYQLFPTEVSAVFTEAFTISVARQVPKLLAGGN